jgi:uncharacterized membrane protein
MVEKIRTNHKSSQGKIFAWMALMLGFTINLIYPIFPNFIKTIVKTDEAVSLFYAAMAIILLFMAIMLARPAPRCCRHASRLAHR